MPLLVALAAGIGLATPPVGACLRTLLRDPAAFAVEASAVELTWVFGPPLVLSAGALFSTGAALAGAGLVLLASTAAFAAHPSSRAWRPAANVTRPRGGSLRTPAMQTLALVLLCVGVLFGAVEIGVAAASNALGATAAAGPLLGVWGVGSLAGGALAARAARRDAAPARRAAPAARRVPSAAARRRAVARCRRAAARGRRAAARLAAPLRGGSRLTALLLALTAAHLALVAAAGSVYALAAVLFLAGAAIAPTYAAVFALVERAAPAGTVTEAFAWLATAVAVGSAAGAATAGAIAEHAGPAAVFAFAGVAGVCALAATAVALGYRGRVPDVLIDADTIRSPELRHEVPASIVDPFLYGERDGVAFAAVSPLDAPSDRAGPGPDLRQLDVFTDLGLNDLIASGVHRDDALLEIRVRACNAMGVTRAAVPPAFPLATAERLRAAGIELYVDRELFATRRRNKTAAELAGIRRATAAAEAGLLAAAAALRAAEPHNGTLHLDGEPLTCERVSAAVRAAVERRGAALGTFTVAHGAQTATGHGPGFGPIAPGEPVIVDLAPQDRESACFADIARTFVVGEPDPRDRRVARAGPRGARHRDRRRPRGRERPRSVQRSVRPLRGRGLRHPASPGRDGDGGLPDRARPRRRARDPREPGPRPLRRCVRRGRRDHDRAVPVPAGLRRRPGRGPAARHRGRRRAAQLAPDRSSSGGIRVGRCRAVPCACR